MTRFSANWMWLVVLVFGSFRKSYLYVNIMFLLRIRIFLLYSTKMYILYAAVLQYLRIKFLLINVST